MQRTTKRSDQPSTAADQRLSQPWQRISTSCPAWGKDCHGFHRLNHFRSQRRSSARNPAKFDKSEPHNHSFSSEPRGSDTTRCGHQPQRKHCSVHLITDRGNIDSESDNHQSYVFIVAANDHKKQPIVTVSLQSTPVSFIVDTGASVNLIGFNKFFQLIQQPTLQKVQVSIIYLWLQAANAY